MRLEAPAASLPPHPGQPRSRLCLQHENRKSLHIQLHDWTFIELHIFQHSVGRLTGHIQQQTQSEGRADRGGRPWWPCSARQEALLAAMCSPADPAPAHMANALTHSFTKQLKRAQLHSIFPAKFSISNRNGQSEHWKDAVRQGPVGPRPQQARFACCGPARWWLAQPGPQAAAGGLLRPLLASPGPCFLQALALQPAARALLPTGQRPWAPLGAPLWEAAHSHSWPVRP